MPRILFIILTIFLFSCDTKPDINNLKYWTYKVDYEIENSDSIKPIGQIEFLRTKPIKDSLRRKVYNEPWYPSMSFGIYNISDLKHCEEISRQTKVFSSCVDPNVGGDLIINQNYIFLNYGVCLNCIGTENEIDFCRPVTNKILSELDLTMNSTLNDIDREIGIKIKKTK